MKSESIEDMLMKITMDVDNMLADLLQRHQLPPTTLSTIVFARLTRMNFEMDNVQGFVDLARKCLDDAELMSTEVSSDHVH